MLGLRTTALGSESSRKWICVILHEAAGHSVLLLHIGIGRSKSNLSAGQGRDRERNNIERENQTKYLEL
ncbi:Hypothetical predicted protein [Podarcis lilfordi]|nr:Hypothetical predicted protein [Podarcis lilfordi]